jgi:glycosidase
MWALRGALAQNYETMMDVEATIRTGEETWSGSGAVMGLILDNHDTSRFVTLAAGQDDGRTWTPAPQPTDAAAYLRTQMALAMLYTLPGAPILYYGDEVALAGKSDPDSRRVMPDGSALGALQTATRDLVHTLAKAHACSDALRRGTYRTLYVDAEHLVYAREAPGGQVAFVDVQRATTAPLSARLPGIPAGSWVDVLSGRTLSLSSELTMLSSEPFSVSLYVPAHSPCAP